MNDNSENPSERNALSASAPAEGGGAGQPAQKRPRKRRRYRRPVRAKAAPGAEASVVPAEAESGEDNSAGGSSGEVGLIASQAEPEPFSERAEEGEGSEDESGADPTELPAGSAVSTATEPGMPGAVHKKRRHRGGRRHRRRRPDGQAALPGAVP
ncbi:MAG: hypothetical protein HGA76_11525, partial [Candidatus Firestonebacteria bacterium]|nr:hypothetical protein [Candidatus Firestonebacteria bacterium]